MAEPGPKGYETLNEAIYHAAQAARATRENKAEAMSVIYEHNGRFHFTEPQSQGNDARVQAGVKIPKSARVSALVHNHPDGAENHKFSHGDIEQAEKLKVPSAIIFGEGSTIRLFTPGKTQVIAPMRGIRNRRSSLGDEFAGMMQ